MIKIILSTVLLSCITLSHVMANEVNNFLLLPSGQYGVAFEDLHWLNNNLCPDPLFSEKNKNDFSPENTQHCHELMVRVYYPTALNSYAASSYYRPAIEFNQKYFLRSVPGIQSKYIDQLTLLKSHTIKNAAPVENKQFPVIIYSPGFGSQTQSYENIITDLVSHGYIVMGINSVFIDGDIELPDGHVVHTVLPNNRAEALTLTKIVTSVLEQDISFVYNKIHVKSQNIVFQSMELKHIGALGHSIGGKAIANVVNQHPDWFQALITLDMGSSKLNDSIMKFNIPCMHIISAYYKSFFNWPLRYHLGKNGYLVVLSPSEKEKHYSYHMNFNDFSTLQYMPAFQAFMAYERSKLAVGNTVLIQTTLPKDNEFKHRNKPTYVLVKSKDTWKVFYYETGKKMREIAVEVIPGLQSGLNNLPPLKQLTKFDRNSIKNLINTFHQQYGNFLGKGNGFKITKAIDAYVLNFFNHFLKDKPSMLLKQCRKISEDTVIECGAND